MTSPISRQRRNPNEDPYRLKFQAGPRFELSPHPHACDLEDLPNQLSQWSHGLRAVDLFCGAGGLSLGLHMAGFDVVLAVDRREDAIATHRGNFGGCSMVADLQDETVLEQITSTLKACGEIDLVAGGPPCQPFSRAVRWRRIQKAEEFLESHGHKRELWRSFMQVVKEVRPRAFLMENVPDLAQTREQHIFREILQEAESLGYVTDARLIHAYEFGVPQLRQRLFIVGFRDGTPFSWPEPTHADQPVPLQEAIEDLPALDGGWWEETPTYQGPKTDYQRLMRLSLQGEAVEGLHDHITRAVREDDRQAFRLLTADMNYEDLPEELRRYSTRNADNTEKFTDKYNRLSWKKPSRTITAHISQDGYWYIHPSQHRTLSIREAARIQSFPDWFRFHGHPTSRFRQIGEAVAPLVGRALGLGIADQLSEQYRPDERTIRAASWRQSVRQLLQQWSTNPLRPENARPWRDSGDLWLILLGELAIGRIKQGSPVAFWPDIEEAWGSPSLFLEDQHHYKTLKSFGLEAEQPLLERCAQLLLNTEELLEDDLAAVGLSRDRARLLMALTGQSQDRPSTAALERFRARLTGQGESESRQRRELQLGMLMGLDRDGTCYRAALEIAEIWCQPQPACLLCPMRQLCQHWEGR